MLIHSFCLLYYVYIIMYSLYLLCCICIIRYLFCLLCYVYIIIYCNTYQFYFACNSHQNQKPVVYAEYHQVHHRVCRPVFSHVDSCYLLEVPEVPLFHRAGDNRHHWERHHHPQHHQHLQRNGDHVDLPGQRVVSTAAAEAEVTTEQPTVINESRESSNKHL